MVRSSAAAVLLSLLWASVCSAGFLRSSEQHVAAGHEDARLAEGADMLHALGRVQAQAASFVNQTKQWATILQGPEVVPDIAKIAMYDTVTTDTMAAAMKEWDDFYKKYTDMGSDIFRSSLLAPREARSFISSTQALGRYLEGLRRVQKSAFSLARLAMVKNYSTKAAEEKLTNLATNVDIAVNGAREFTQEMARDTDGLVDALRAPLSAANPGYFFGLQNKAYASVRDLIEPTQELPRSVRNSAKVTFDKLYMPSMAPMQIGGTGGGSRYEWGSTTALFEEVEDPSRRLAHHWEEAESLLQRLQDVAVELREASKGEPGNAVLRWHELEKVIANVTSLMLSNTVPQLYPSTEMVEQKAALAESLLHLDSFVQGAKKLYYTFAGPERNVVAERVGEAATDFLEPLEHNLNKIVLKLADVKKGEPAWCFAQQNKVFTIVDNLGLAAQGLAGGLAAAPRSF